MATREDILNYVDTDIGVVEVPEMGGKIHLASLSVEEMDRLANLGEGKPAAAAIVVLGICDEKGNRLFTDADIETIAKKPARLISKISKAVMAHNNMGPTAAAEAKNGSSETAS